MKKYKSIFIFYLLLATSPLYPGETAEENIEYMVYIEKEESIISGSWKLQESHYLKKPGQEKEYLFSIWKNPTTKNCSFTLFSNNPNEFEFLTSPDGNERRLGPEIYSRNKYADIAKKNANKIVSELRQNKGEKTLTLAKEVQKIEQYKKEVLDQAGVAIEEDERIQRVLKLTPKVRLSDNAPNPFLVQQLYYIYVNAEQRTL
jgi:hypothetical protein